ncbi:ArnT family glycosyltransferase [Saccharopolyspora sp. CA-218241]|uniref:ArnT family glycosyltransferase n=1 Tax=Saccharopolyspora sp. CA-218241 TaxID=3240027 RepID=UPI003D95EBF8
MLPRPFARGPVWAIAAATFLLLVLLSGRYGYLTDELYFLAAGALHLDWGYMDQQPLVPLLAAGLDAVFPGSLLALRLPAAVCTALGVVVTGLIAREFGGDRRAQVLAAAAYPLSPWVLLSGHWLAAATVELLLWVLLLWLVIRWARTRHDGLLLAAALVAGVSVQTKFQVVVLCAALLVSCAVVGPRRVLARPLLWLGAGISALAAVPTLLWQARHDWPAVRMGAVVDAENSRLLLLPTALVYSGAVVGAFLCCYGIVRLLRGPELRPYRFVGWAVLGVVLFFLVTSGRPNYLIGLCGPLFAAAAVGLQHRRERSPRPRGRWLAWPAYAVSVVLPLAVLPVYPLDFLAKHPAWPNPSRLYETGWEDLVDAVAGEVAALPAEQRARTAIIGETYYLTGALDVLGRDLPPVFSPHRGYWYFGAPSERIDTVLHVGTDDRLGPHFAARRSLGTVRSEHANMAQGVSLTLYEDPLDDWAALWPRLRTR